MYSGVVELMFENLKKAYLLLADGTEFEGFSFGIEGEVVGEVVFTTAMTGYQETLTDPSYNGQLVTQTFPLIGNYGVNSLDSESAKCHLSGYIVREWCEMPSNFRSEGTINEFLVDNKIVGIHGIDTRALTRILREHGVTNGMISSKPDYEKAVALKKIAAFVADTSVKNVTSKEIASFAADDSSSSEKFSVVMLDYGAKYSIRKALTHRGCNVTIVPSDTSAAAIKTMNPDGIMLSNGPGDPASNPVEIANLKDIVKLGVPIFGICLGHQILALSQGAKAVKLKYGHRGENQPVTDLKTKRTFVTSQNHGYAIVGDSIDKSKGAVSHINGNDGSCEGIEYTAFNAFTVQFHPEACGGPEDTAFLFDRFISAIQIHKHHEEMQS